MSAWLARFVGNLLAVAYKEAAIIRHDHTFLAVLFVQPIMFFILFGVALSNTPRNVAWAVLDRSDTVASRRLIADIGRTGHFLTPEPVTSYAEGRARLRRGAILAMVTVPHDFDRELAAGRGEIQALLDGADPLQAARVAGYLAEVGAGFAALSAIDADRAATAVRRPGPLDVRQRFWFNPTLSDRFFFVIILAGMLITNLCLSATSLAIVGERENGTYEQMLALPTTSVEILLGKLTPYVVLCYVELLVAIVPIGILFDIWPRGSWLAIALITFPFVLASLAIGTFISGWTRTSAQAVFLSVFFILPSFVLSGVTMPYQFMPDGVRAVGGLLPLRWYQISLRGISARGAELSDMGLPALVLTIIFVVMLTGVAWRLKPHLD